MENAIKTGFFRSKVKNINAVVSSTETDAAVAEIYTAQLEIYSRLNKFAAGGSVVLFGSCFSKNIPVCELKQTFDMNCNIYNRSFDNLTAADAETLYKRAVAEINPSKILVQLGETDLERGFKTIPEIISSYEALVSAIRKTDKRCEIVVVSVCENGSNVQPGELNTKLKEMAERLGCKYADITSAFTNDSPDVKAFSLLRHFMRDRITFCEAMNI